MSVTRNLGAVIVVAALGASGALASGSDVQPASKPKPASATTPAAKPANPQVCKPAPGAKTATGAAAKCTDENAKSEMSFSTLEDIVALGLVAPALEPAPTPSDDAQPVVWREVPPPSR